MSAFPKTVVIEIDHPQGLPKVNCKGQMGIALRPIDNGDYWEVRFYGIGEPEHFVEAAFHKNNLRVIA